MVSARPTIPLRLTTVMSEEAIKLVTEFKAWFGQKEIIDLVKAKAKEARDFLIDNHDRLPLPDGGTLTEPWAKIEDVPVEHLQKTDDEIRLDLRLSQLRLKTFAVGACRLIGILDADALPKNAISYSDRSTNLVEWALHERLMRSYLKAKASVENNPNEIGSLKMDDLMGLYLYEPKSQQEAVRAKIVQMVSVGLWEADPPKGARDWKIRAGPLAIQVHLEVFGPVVKHYKRYLKGGFEGRILGKEEADAV
ncbi:hypothetical protein [Rhizobium leguminosarum]|uniref:hypothetical protein n=1 Tax=Rhizobium leguminosarum TaxID=384 RepID=UPI00103170DC|nr:hypothetical protein [Rhizobium leguminosarum]TBG52562.1 hypothetical protein ELG74_36305 [Rhizobium leguminosarum]